MSFSEDLFSGLKSLFGTPASFVIIFSAVFIFLVIYKRECFLKIADFLVNVPMGNSMLALRRLPLSTRWSNGKISSLSCSHKIAEFHVRDHGRNGFVAQSSQGEIATFRKLLGDIKEAKEYLKKNGYDFVVLSGPTIVESVIGGDVNYNRKYLRNFGVIGLETQTVPKGAFQAKIRTCLYFRMAQKIPFVAESLRHRKIGQCELQKIYSQALVIKLR